MYKNFEDLLRASMSVNKGVNNLGEYSPLSGFENESLASKNPYQQILSSKQQETKAPSFELGGFDKFLLEKGETTKAHDRFMKQSDYKNAFNTHLAKDGQTDLLIKSNNLNLDKIVKDIDKRKEDDELKSLAKQLGLPEDMAIDSTFYNRKDIYDLKQRLDASGIETPDKNKEKPGIITRALNILSAPGQAVTTALYNATDDNEETKALKGLIDGLVGSLTSDEDKIKTGSDLLDNAFGERDGNEGLGEKLARGVGGFVLDVGLDPTTYLTAGTSALVKGASKKVGQEVTEQAVKGAIKGVNGVGDVAKAGNVLDLEQQAKRITKEINERAVKNRKGVEFSIPFTKIEKEIISAEKVAEIGKALGLQSTVGKGLDKLGDGAKGIWNYKKGEDGIRNSLEAIPEAIKKRFDTNYDVNKLIKNGDSLEASRLMATKEVKKQLDFTKKKDMEEYLGIAKGLMQQMDENGWDSTKISSIIEKMETYKVDDVIDTDTHLSMLQKFEKDIDSMIIDSSKKVTGAENEMRKKMKELVQDKVVEMQNVREMKNLFEENGIKYSDEISKEANEEVLKKHKEENKMTPEELGTKPLSETKNIEDLKKAYGTENDWEVVAVNSKTQIKDFLRASGMDAKEFDSFYKLSKEEKKSWLTKVKQRKIKEYGIEVVNGKIKGAENIKKWNKIRSEIVDLDSQIVAIENSYKKDLASFENKSSINTYKPAKTEGELMLKVDEIIEKEKRSILKKAKDFENTYDAKDPQGIFNRTDYADLTDEEALEQGLEIAEKYFEGANVKGIAKEEFASNYAKAIREGKLDPSKGTLENFVDSHRPKIQEQITHMQNIKDQVILELGLPKEEYISDIFDKFVENRVLNMVNPKSQYFFSPYRNITPKQMAHDFKFFLSGGKNKGGLLEAVRKNGDMEAFKKGESIWNKVSVAELHGMIGNYNRSVKSSLENEATKYVKDILEGRGIDSSASKIFDEAVHVEHKATGKKVKLDDLLRKTNAIREEKGLAKITMTDINKTKKAIAENKKIDKAIEYKIKQIEKLESKTVSVKNFDSTKKQIKKLEDEIKSLKPIKIDREINSLLNEFNIVNGEGGILQQVKERARTLVGDKYKDVKLSELPAKERQSLLRKARKEVENLLDEGDYFGGKLDVTEGQKPRNFIQENEEKFVQNREKPLRTKNTYTQDEYNSIMEGVSKVPKELKEIMLIGDSDKKADALRFLHSDTLDKKEELEELLRNNEIGYQDFNNAKKEIRQLDEYIKQIEKESNINKTSILDEITGVDMSTPKNGVYAEGRQRNTVEQTKSWGSPDRTVNVSKILKDDTPLKPKTQKQEATVKALQEEYKARREKIKYESAVNSAEFEVAVTEQMPKGVTVEAMSDTKEVAQTVIDKVKDRSIRDMNVPELKQMLKDMGIKGISKSNREELLNIADIVANQNVRASVDMSKKTPEEIKRFMKQLGIKDTQMDEFLNQFVGAKKDVEHLKNVKQSIIDAKELKDIERLENIYELQFGKGFTESIKKNRETFITNRNKKGERMTPVELVTNNKEVIDMLGGGEQAEKFIVEYTDFMERLAQTEEDLGLLAKEQRVKSQGYVARRMSDEAREKVVGNTDLNAFLEGYFRDRKDLIYKDPKFAESRKFTDSKQTIADLNETIYKKTLEKFGEEGAIKNFFERDLSRIMIQRIYEHGNAFYDKSLQDMYLGKMGIKMDWTKGFSGDSYNIVEGMGKKWNGENGNDFKALMNAQDFKTIKEEVENFMPHDSYLPDGKLQKAKDNALASIKAYEDYLKKIDEYKASGKSNKEILDKMNKKRLSLQKDIYTNLPQRAMAREIKQLVKNGDMVLIYPKGKEADVVINALNDSGVEKVLQKERLNTKNTKMDLEGYEKINYDDIEKIKTTSKEVPVYAVDKHTYNAYVKSMTEQMVKDTDSFVKVYDKFTNIWKKMATTSAGFHVRNAFGNAFQMYLDVGMEAFKPSNVVRGYDVMKNSSEVLVKKAWNGKSLTGKEINDLLKQVGIGDVTQLSGEFNQVRKGKATLEEALKNIGKTDFEKAMDTKNPIEKVFGVSQFVGDKIETLAKAQQFAILLDKGYDPLTAKKHIDKFLFDYGDLTDFETDFMKRVIPFYTFMRKNTELQLDTIMNNPTPLKTVNRLFENQRKSMLSTEEEQLLTENDKSNLIVQGKDGKRRSIDTNLPWIEEINPLGAINPLIKTPLELATNKNFTFKNDIATYDGQVKQTQGIEKLIGNILGVTEKSEDGNTYIDAKTKHAITNMLPSVRTADKSWANLTADDTVGGLLAFFGLGGQEFNTEKRTSQEVRQYKELLENIEKKAQSKGINTREKLKEKQELEALLGGQQDIQALLNALNIR